MSSFFDLRKEAWRTDSSSAAEFSNFIALSVTGPQLNFGEAVLSPTRGLVSTFRKTTYQELAGERFKEPPKTWHFLII